MNVLFPAAKDIDSGEFCLGKSVLIHNRVLCIFYAGAESGGSCGQAGFPEVLNLYSCASCWKKHRNNHQIELCVHSSSPYDVPF